MNRLPPGVLRISTSPSTTSSSCAATGIPPPPPAAVEVDAPAPPGVALAAEEGLTPNAFPADENPLNVLITPCGGGAGDGLGCSAAAEPPSVEPSVSSPERARAAAMASMAPPVAEPAGGFPRLGCRCTALAGVKADDDEGGEADGVVAEGLGVV